MWGAGAAGPLPGAAAAAAGATPAPLAVAQACSSVRQLHQLVVQHSLLRRPAYFPATAQAAVWSLQTCRRRVPPPPLLPPGSVSAAARPPTRARPSRRLARPCSTESDVKHAHREIMNHQRLLHPHVVQLKEVFSSKPYLALVMEFVPNGDMFQVGAGSAECWRL